MRGREGGKEEEEKEWEKMGATMKIYLSDKV